MADGTAISCQEIVEVVTDYLEGRMAICDGCQWYLDQIRITIATVGRIEDEEVPAELRDTVLGAFRHRFRA